MNFYLIAGTGCETIKSVLESTNNTKIIGYDQSFRSVFDNIKSKKANIDRFVITDQGIDCSTAEFRKLLSDFRAFVNSMPSKPSVVFITKEPQYEEIFRNITAGDEKFNLHFIDRIKVPASLLKDFCKEEEREPEESKPEETVTSQNNEPPEGKKKWNIFGRGTSHSKENTNEEAHKKNAVTYNEEDILSAIQGNTSRVIAFTGHRGAGTTSTAVNIAMEASARGLRTIILDFDIFFRGMNLYFSKFGEEVGLNPELGSSLIKCLLKPDSYVTNSCRINENLYISALAYSLSSNDKMFDFITPKRIMNLIAILKQKFNVIILDIPIEFFKEYSEILIHIDRIGLCMNNNLYSIINSDKCITEIFETEDARVFGIKTKVIMTKFTDTNRHQGKRLTQEMACEILSSISDNFDQYMECAGIVPYHAEFDSQVDTGKKLSSISRDYKGYYSNVLKNLL